MNTHDHRKLFSPVQIGPITLGHRVVMAPLTRSRSQQPGDIPNDLMREYYTQRASEGGFIVTEATNISITGRGWLGAPAARRSGALLAEGDEPWSVDTCWLRRRAGLRIFRLRTRAAGLAAQFV